MPASTRPADSDRGTVKSGNGQPTGDAHQHPLLDDLRQRFTTRLERDPGRDHAAETANGRRKSAVFEQLILRTLQGTSDVMLIRLFQQTPICCG